MNSYVFMDQESTNRQLLLEFWRLLPEMVMTTMCAQRVTMVDMPKNTLVGVQSHAQLCDHGSGVHESAIIAQILETPPRNGHDDHVCPKGQHGLHTEKYVEWGTIS